MKKILFTATVQSHICQFHLPYIKMLKDMGYEVHVAARDNLAEKEGLTLEGPDKVFNVPFSRSPLKKENLKAYKTIKEIIDKNDYDVINCNTPMGGVISRLAARTRKKSKTKVIYIAHGFHFFKGAPVTNWLLYFPIEFFLSYITDALLTINKEDFQRAKKYFHAKETYYIPGIGVRTEKFRVAVPSTNKREEIGVPNDSIILLSVGELYPRKNHEVMIKAMARLKENNIYYVICGNGILDKYLYDLAQQNGVEDKIIFAGYRRDIPEIMKVSDIYVFPSMREGLGLAGIEAMASGLPMVTSNINGILDYMEEGKSGFLCPPDNDRAFAEAITKMIVNSKLRDQMGHYNIKAAQKFDVENVKDEMRKIYKEIETNKLK
ncbi:glycosyltransferase family 4 protein [Rossellomorea vietnamensis]|uniref:Glycosyltransferase family 4 protein n=1 Tax=Rossellomorea vietnamensis TaxID=218284 RepID=A0A5D4M3D0_9BACI|nr:glycosyltransferase family 4 protein [Rossellomorea vietnamensis]TYR95908.1 glycosyltransferase family 4 protein [Rossellomorea vietnamensis]